MKSILSRYNKRGEEITNWINDTGLPLNNGKDLSALMDKIADSKYILLGEASHGTHEFYTWRTEITKQLIRDKKISFIAVEGDWPDCYRINRYIKSYSDSGENALDVIKTFKRWPTWMWANWEIVALAEWLKDYNQELPEEEKIGFYGLDVYSLGESLEAILNYLEENEPQSVNHVKKAFNCFEPFGFEGQNYARATSLSPENCEEELIALLREIRSNPMKFDGDREAVLSAEQNAHVAINAERYYRAMIAGGAATWNIRDRHMTETLVRLMEFHGKKSGAVIWAHNTHIGDARATDMAENGMVNIGQLITEKHKSEGVIKVGFGSYSGKVIAGSSWGATMQKMTVPQGIEASWENLIHNADGGNKLLLMENWQRHAFFDDDIPHRAIGVVYNPDFEQYGNYVPSIIPFRYDAFIHIDQTTALHALHLHPDINKLPETYPWNY